MESTNGAPKAMEVVISHDAKLVTAVVISPVRKVHANKYIIAMTTTARNRIATGDAMTHVATSSLFLEVVVALVAVALVVVALVAVALVVVALAAVALVAVARVIEMVAQVQTVKAVSFLRLHKTRGAPAIRPLQRRLGSL